MSGAIPPLPNTPSRRGAQLKAQGQLYLYLTVIGKKKWNGSGGDKGYKDPNNQIQNYFPGYKCLLLSWDSGRKSICGHTLWIVTLVQTNESLMEEFFEYR
jgi:hypothetical protein